MEDRFLYIVTNDSMLDFVNNNKDTILFQKYNIIANTEFKNKFDSVLLNIIYSQYQYVLFDILDNPKMNPKINYVINTIVDKNNYDILFEYINFFKISQYDISIID